MMLNPEMVGSTSTLDESVGLGFRLETGVPWALGRCACRGLDRHADSIGMLNLERAIELTAKNAKNAENGKPNTCEVLTEG